MSDFKVAILTVLKHEGGFVNNPHDPGGATKFGISQRYLQIQGYEDKNIQQLSQEEAIQIYQTDWWDKHNYGAITHQIIATKLFDLAVNMGSKQSHICLQRAIHAATGNALQEDGVLGEITLTTVNETNTEILLAALKSEAAGFYRSLNNSTFEKGWLTRAYS